MSIEIMGAILTVVGVCLLVFAGIAVWRSRGTKRDTVRLPVLAPTCARCIHFDIEEMQATFTKNPAFMRAAATLSPAEMAYGYTHDAEGNRTGIAAPDAKARKMRWDQFGVCAEHAQGRHQDDTCEAFSAREAAT